MSADFLSGLVLLGVLLFGAGYLVKAFFWESLSGVGQSLSGLIQSVSGSMAARRAAPARQPNDHLVGAVGRVIDDGTASGMIRVRVGMETWRARSIDESAALPTGTEVEIKAVDGLVLEVAGRAVAAEQPGT